MKPLIGRTHGQTLYLAWQRRRPAPTRSVQASTFQGRIVHRRDRIYEVIGSAWLNFLDCKISWLDRTTAPVVAFLTAFTNAFILFVSFTPGLDSTPEATSTPH